MSKPRPSLKKHGHLRMGDVAKIAGEVSRDRGQPITPIERRRLEKLVAGHRNRAAFRKLTHDL